VGGCRGGGQPGAHLAGLQVGKLEQKGGLVINNLLIHHFMVIMEIRSKSSTVGDNCPT
jgi:hypothetical protein